MYDILIRNGTLMFAGRNSHTKADIAIESGRIAEIGQISESSDEIGSMTHVIDASGCLVVPGLIDLHTHVYPLASFGSPIEAACFVSGVTATLDCGSAGVSNYKERRSVIDTSQLQIKTLINVCSDGITVGANPENVDPSKYEYDRLEEMVHRYSDEIIGLKIRHGAEMVRGLGLKPLEKTIEMAERLKLPVMVHCTNPPGNLDDMLRLLRPGDVLSHAYQDRGSTIIAENGKVSDAAWEARERGVIFDVANSNVHFSFSVARAAIADGFLPDVISTDMTVSNLYRRPASFSLLHVMSKYLNMGLSMEQILERCITFPAKFFEPHKKLGTLEKNSAGDIAVLKVEQKTTVFSDRIGERMVGERIIRNMMTVKNGIIVYRDIAF